ncbi:effector-binding domain-containing protein [Rhodopseudomonas rhenobacensis]|uniref:Effector-binding domain-containing protein n=1 Tax=Rhodopseudomonas rhenobacensis TaxID=87461 RepID=A0A7W8DXA9_9BRAD|nr:GyrI-like domain-containing protein [Rhodopseudomonas rhenobacensis]MBB5045557.1 effector-binding domain-containing protein [Rhodopseudomonas rhenobacensis]
MDVARCFRLAMAAPLATAGILIGISGALAQSPPAVPAPTASEPTKSAAEEPAKPAAAAPAKPADPANPPAATPATPPPAAAEAPVTPAPATPPPAAPVQTADPFGEEITLTGKSVVVLKGSANWDSAFETLIESFKTLTALLDKQAIKPAGNVMIVYTSTDDTGFTYQAEIPVEQEPKDLAKNMSLGKSPDGKALKFVHRGSYDNMDNTYEAITNHLDDKKLEAKDTFVEEYITDPLKTAEDKLVINVYVPLK